MKALIKKPGWRGKASLMIMVLLAATGFAEAQLPNCVDGNIMYASFNNLVDQSDSTEIRPVNVATGAVGSLMGGKRYWIRKRSSSSNPYVYGTAALGVDQITNRFYVITHMNTASNTIMPKDIITIDPVTGIMT
ncbi:MAG TPA: hypothetical protein VD996_17660, partial [Chitinophagaceae bacterium]|nr:hypothetical protein [Chitinophagaceae bacterium]